MKTNRRAGALTALLIALIIGIGFPATATAETPDHDGLTAYSDAELTKLFGDAGVTEDDIADLIAKVRAGEVPDSMKADSAPTEEYTEEVKGGYVTVYRYADGSATTVTSTSGDQADDPKPGTITTRAIAVKGVGCSSKKTSGSTTTYTGCNVEAAYLIGTAKFKFDGKRSGGKFTITRVYGGGCNYLTKCGSPTIVRKTSSSSQHAQAEMAVHGSPIKGVGWTQHLLVRVTNKGVMTAYGDYSYIK
ncbi:hypothetical protein NLU66_07315 [Brachybacterium sp. NBEC-018]|uniref:hypothetical protein n=1 Tax=Brachybacterium sp. NBEC-018 TaxID=2996004 RepID=UPI0021752A6D|nr:hypothetical protein [Brachybacterium sp. NBEC-018]UVY85389.1 hypothetical protein NLU66_07315 [Brachybacterium sp. NBEC-018]